MTSNELQKDDAPLPKYISLSEVVEKEKQRLKSGETVHWWFDNFGKVHYEPEVTEDAVFEVLPTEIPEDTKKFLEWHNEAKEYVSDALGIPQEREGQPSPRPQPQLPPSNSEI